MADNYETTAGAGGLKFRSDENPGDNVHWPVFKLAYGADGEFVEVTDSAGKRVPVLSYQGGAWSVSLAAAIPAGTNNIGDVDVLTVPADPFGVNADAASATGSISAKLRFIASTGIPITGSVAVTGTFFQATQPVSIAATVTVDTELPAAAALADNTANPTAPAVGAFLMAWDGTNWDRVQTGAAATGALKVDGSAVTQPVSGTVTANMGTVTADPFGANADAASATGSISAKLRFIASTGIPITGTVTVGSHAVTNAGTFVVQENGAALTSLQLIDDIVYVDDTATHATGTSKGALMMAAANPTDSAVDANDIGALAMTLARELKVSVTTALVAGTNNIGDVDVLTVPTDPFGANADAASATGSISAKLRFIAATGIPITSLPASTNTLEVVGDVASDVAIVANPVTVGGRASSAVPTAVGADGRAVNLWLDRSGGLVINGRDAHDAALDANTNPMLVGGRASAAVPTDVSADGDAVRAWFLRSGAQAIQLTVGGKLLGKDEDSGHTTADPGMPVLFVRNDANAAQTSTDLDYGFASIDSAGNVNVIPRTGAKTQTLTSGGLTTSTTAYVAGDQLGNEFTIANAARASGGSGVLRGIRLFDETGVVGACEAWIFDSASTPAGDNAANSWSDANIIKLVRVIPLPAVAPSALNRICDSGDISVPYVCNGSTSLFCVLITRSGHTFFGAATSIKLTVVLEPG